MKKAILFLLLLLSVTYAVLALSAHDIFYADSESLRNMASLRGIDTSLGDEELRTALYEAEGLESYSEEVSGDGSYSVTINNADYLSSSGSLITLRGSVNLSFSHSGDETVMSSDEVVIDTSSSLIIALGNVVFNTTGESSAQEIVADIVTFYWEKGNIVVENATTMNERTNSEDETVNVYSVGERLTYFDSGAAIYENGYIASSDEDPLSSISASRITMLPGSDMLIENAVLNIGRVPLFYFPVFFYPGSRITGNPSFGFTSSRGAFLNTTFELFGHTDLIDSSSSSSFLSIFSNTENSDSQVPRGSYYTDVEDLNVVENWARNTESHLAVMADAYQNVGLHLGLDSRINLFSNSLSFDTFSGVALTYANNANSSNFRYYSENSLSYSYSGLVIALSYPIYSDSNVLLDLGNRITSFSIEPLLFQSPSFPSTYSSSITSFSRYAEIRYTLPQSLISDFLSSFSISRFRAESRYSWSRGSNGEYSYQIDYIDLPELRASASGSIFNFEYQDRGEEESQLDEADRFLLSDPLLYDMFHEDIVRTGHVSSSYSIGMGYTINQNLENNIDYYNGQVDSSSLSSDTSLRLTTELDVGNYFALRSILTPSYSYDREEDDSLSWSDEFSLSNTIEAEIPIIGLKYSLTNVAYEYGRTFSADKLETVDALWAFDEDHVSTHSIALSKTFDTIAGSFTPSISYTLFPLTGSLTPSLSYRYGNFATAFSYRFQNDEDTGSFLSDLLRFSLAYNGTYVVASSSFSYQTGDYDPAAFFSPIEISSQLSLRTADRKYSITEQLEWKGYDSSSGLDNYVSSLRTILTLPYVTCYVDFTGPFSALELNTINARINASDILIRGWRNRLYLSLGLSSTLNLDIQNIAASSFTITPSIIFSIAEFLDFRLSFTSSNNNFGAYQDGGTFSFSKLWDDLLRSFDFFGDGRYNTNFNMSSVSLEVVHYMQDWALHCNYSTSVVLSNDVYRFVPEFSIYLSWNTFPDLNIDESWEMRNSTWVRSN